MGVKVEPRAKASVKDTELVFVRCLSTVTTSGASNKGEARSEMKFTDVNLIGCHIL